MQKAHSTTLRACVRVCVGVHVCTSVCGRLCLRVCGHACVHVFACVRVCTHAGVWARVLTCVCASVCVRVGACLCVGVCARVCVGACGRLRWACSWGVGCGRQWGWICLCCICLPGTKEVLVLATDYETYAIMDVVSPSEGAARRVLKLYSKPRPGLDGERGSAELPVPPAPAPCGGSQL